MKYFLYIFLSLFSFSGIAQSRTKQIRDSIDILIPLNVQPSPLKVRQILKSILDKKEIISKEPIANSNVDFVDKGHSYSYPQNNQGGLAKYFTLKFWRMKNATTFDVVLSKTATLTNPVTYVSLSANLNLSGLDTNQVYYWKFRGRNNNFTGEWSDIKRFDTYKKPLGVYNLNSIFDLAEYIVSYPLDFIWNRGMNDNLEYGTYLRVADKQIFFRHIKTDITNFPLTVLTNVSQILYENETSCMVYYVWGKTPEYMDIAPYTNIVGTNLVMSLPVTKFPISKIEFYSTIFYIKP